MPTPALTPFVGAAGVSSERERQRQQELMRMLARANQTQVNIDMSNPEPAFRVSEKPLRQDASGEQAPSQEKPGLGTNQLAGATPPLAPGLYSPKRYDDIRVQMKDLWSRAIDIGDIGTLDNLTDLSRSIRDSLNNDYGDAYDGTLNEIARDHIRYGESLAEDKEEKADKLWREKRDVGYISFGGNPRMSNKEASDTLDQITSKLAFMGDLSSLPDDAMVTINPEESLLMDQLYQQNLAKISEKDTNRAYKAKLVPKSVFIETKWGSSAIFNEDYRTTQHRHNMLHEAIITGGSVDEGTTDPFFDNDLNSAIQQILSGENPELIDRVRMASEGDEDQLRMLAEAGYSDPAPLFNALHELEQGDNGEETAGRNEGFYKKVLDFINPNVPIGGGEETVAEEPPSWEGNQ